jgi:hypothetical protein
MAAQFALGEAVSAPYLIQISWFADWLADRLC